MAFLDSMDYADYGVRAFVQDCDRFEKYLLASKPRLESFHPFFEKAFWEMLEKGGKRFRPNLLLAVVSAEARAAVLNSFDVALAIECLHTYSLIHDDLPSMDNASLRRGHPTLHTRYGETGAILVGDGLNTYSFYLLSRARLAPATKVALIECLSYNGGLGGMVLGQALDCAFEGVPLMENGLEFIHRHKTGALIAASLKMGALIAGLDSKKQNLLYDFGQELGLFFQLRDDLIDATQDDLQAGKSTHKDEAKNSYVNLLGIDGARDRLIKQSSYLKESLNELGLDGVRKNLEVLLSSYLAPI